jgi:hypothetical protein
LISSLWHKQLSPMLKVIWKYQLIT